MPFLYRLKNFSQVANNPKYKENAVKMNAIYLDRIIPSLEESKFYIERIIKKKGDGIYFHRKGMDLNLVKFFYVDLIILLIVFFALISG